MTRAALDARLQSWDVDTYRELFERSADAILLIEGDAFIDCNQAAVEMLRCGSRAEVMSLHPSALSPPTQPDGQPSYEKANAMMAAAFETGSHRFEWDHLRADGEVFPVEVLLTAMELDGRRLLHTVWRDVTERKRLEAQLRHAQKMEAIGKLAGGIAHDFNNLLVVILGHAELLEDELGDAPARAHAAQIRGAGQRAAELVQRLLAFGRKQQLHPTVIDLRALVSGLRDMLGRLIGEDVALTTRLDDAPIHVEVDPGQLEQALFNLASNARDAMPDGGALVIGARRVVVGQDDVGATHGLGPGEYALLTVTDSGVGMDEATAARAFDPFFTTKAPGKGTGLGLSTVYGVVRQSGGAVQLYSAPGRGTSVKIFLPIAASGPRVAPLADDRPAPGGSERLLVVEDESGVGALVSQALGRAGYAVTLARDGAEALALLEAAEADYALILSDVIMPRMGGPELVTRLLAGGQRPRVLFMSGYTDDALARFAPGLQAYDLLEKPFSVRELLRRVRAALDR